MCLCLVDNEAYDILPVFDIDNLEVVPGLTVSSLWSLWDCAHWFSIDSVCACVRVDIEAYDILPVFDIDNLGVVPGLTESSLWGREFTTYFINA